MFDGKREDEVVKWRRREKQICGGGQFTRLEQDFREQRIDR